MSVNFIDFSENEFNCVAGNAEPGSGCIDVQRVTGAANRLPKPMSSFLNAACEIVCVLPENLAKLTEDSLGNEEDEGHQ